MTDAIVSFDERERAFDARPPAADNEPVGGTPCTANSDRLAIDGVGFMCAR